MNHLLILIIRPTGCYIRQQNIYLFELSLNYISQPLIPSLFFCIFFFFFPYRPRHSVPPTHKHTNQPIRKLMSHNLYHHHHHLHQSHQKSIIIDNIYTYMRLIGVFFTDHNKTKTAEKKRGKQDITTKWTIFQCS